MPYVSKEQLTAAREVDLLTYLRCFEPQELVHISGSTYVTRTHDSLKICAAHPRRIALHTASVKASRTVSEN